MEVKEYIRVIVKNWRILLVSVGVTVVATLLFTLRQPRVYESLASFVIRPHSSLIVQDDFVSTLETLSRRVEINNTFAEVANSKLIKDQAIERLGLNSTERRGLSADGRVLVGTNILEVKVKAEDPEVAQAFAGAVSLEIVDFVSNLYDVFELGPLDSASLATRPISPKIGVNLVLGAVLGIGLGLALIFLYEYLRTPDGHLRQFDILDPDTGAYNRAYLEMRLRQEVSRVRHSNGELALALIRIRDRGAVNDDGGAGREAMPSAATLFGPLLRDEDLLARFDDTTFAVMMPEMCGPEAKVVVEELHLKLGAVPLSLDQYNVRTSGFRGVASVVELCEHDANAEELLQEAMMGLKEAERGTYGRVALRPMPAHDSPRQANGQVQPGLANGSLPLGASQTASEYPEQVQHEPKPSLTRAALKLAQQHGIDPDTIQGSGKDGRVLKSDVKRLIKDEPELGLSAQT
jgi:diguanylate cyclase (GGDEF)-like protein